MDFDMMPRGQGQRQQRPPQRYIEKRRRRRKAIMMKVIAFFVLIIFIVGIVLGIILLKGKSFTGTFEREVDVTELVSADIALWLSDIDGAEIDTQWVKSRVEPYTVKEILTLSDTYSRTVDPDSYAKLTQRVNDDIDKLLSEIIKDKLVEKGYKEQMTDDEALAITSQVLGMSASEFLSSNGISLVPTIDEIAEIVIGSANGLSCSFEKSGNKITITSQDVSETEQIIYKKGTLVFTESGRVYNEKE